VAARERQVNVARQLVVHGRVQGVGYRDAAVQTAFTLGVTGWVRNRSDGTVEAHVQGHAGAVDRFVEWCRRGPPLARVSGVDTNDAAFDESLRDFAWRPTV
jgi:acylphosphatase